MNKSEAEKPEARRWQGYTLEEYVVLRNGVPLGDGRSLRNMLERSFGAASFAGFWQYWNPIWGYGLGRYVYAPLRRVLHPAVAFILTFAISGGLHDLATMAVRWSPAFLFTPWFVLLGMGAVVGRVAGMDLGQRPFWLRAAVNLAYLVVCLLPALALRNAIL